MENRNEYVTSAFAFVNDIFVFILGISDLISHLYRKILYFKLASANFNSILFIAYCVDKFCLCLCQIKYYLVILKKKQLHILR